jgi:hypothetical protein
MRTKRLLRVWTRVISVISIALHFALPCPAPPCWFDRSAKRLSVCITVNCSKAKSICKSWSLSVSELQLTAPANAGVQKAESVCRSWRLSVSKLHTYFVEKRYTESVANPVVKDLLRLPCSSGRNSFIQKLICLGGRSNTVLGMEKLSPQPFRLRAATVGLPENWSVRAAAPTLHYLNRAFAILFVSSKAWKLQGDSGFFRGFGWLSRSLLASLSPEKNLRFYLFGLRSASFAAPQNWPLCFAASGNLAMMAANIAPLFQHGESVVLSRRSGRTACVPRSQTLLVAERCALR